MPLLDYTTKVPVSRTVTQVQAMLVGHGARAAMMEWDDEGRINALAFRVKTPNGELPIRLPIDAKATFKVLERQYYDREIPRRYVNEDQAYRVAWRNVFHWVSAQMALLETEMVKMEQIFLPYVITRSGQTLYEVMEEKRFLLGTGEE